MEKFIKVRKKGKTRGRPSKAESLLEKICEHYRPQMEKALLDSYVNWLRYGTSATKIQKNGSKIVFASVGPKEFFSTESAQ